MRNLIALSVVLLLVGSGCGGDTRESLAAEQVPLMKDFVATLDTVNDEASAKAAKPKLKTLVDKMNDINAREAKLPASTEAEQKALGEKYGPEMEALMPKLMGKMMQIQFDPKIQAVLSDLDFKGAMN